MAKKKTKKRRKRRPLKANPKRQAHAQLRGYLYQIWHSVDAWLDLAEDEVLYLEGAEDFDRISGDSATATQVKHTQHNITLRSQEVNDAINNYWELQTNNPDLNVKYRFLTRSQIGVERDKPFGKSQPGLDIWNRCSGDEAAITKISKFLQTEAKISKEISDFLKKAEPQQIYDQLIEPITWETDSKGASFVEASIRSKLIHHGDRFHIWPSNAEKVVDALLKEALMVATQKENRELTRVRFLKIFEEKMTVRTPIQHTQVQQPIDLTGILDYIKAAFIGDLSDITIQSQSPIQTAIPPLYRNVVPRRELLESIQAALQSERIAVIHGGTGRGKTTLAKLTVDAINGAWCWLDFRNIKSGQIAPFLQQLAAEVSNQSSQVNIVLDDLDLRPQELRKYEEDLGVVVYRVLESGAKLLITSQHKLPSNFSRRLNMSQSVIIHVPDFTISEIEQFARQLGCPANNIEAWAKVTQAQTGGHPRLVHALFAQLQQENWKRDIIESILRSPQELVDEREQARQLLLNLPGDQRELLYRLSLMPTEFNKDCALNIGDIPESIDHPGDILSQLIGPWIDPVDETYYKVSPLLTNVAGKVWSKSKINDLHTQIANAILETGDLTTIEAHLVLFHSIVGQNKDSFVAVIRGLMTIPEDNWSKLCQDFSLFIHVKTDPPGELFPGEAFVNYLFRSFQYRIAVEIEPELAPKILAIWDKETKPHEPRQSYLRSRIILATQALMYHPMSLPIRKMVDYLKELIDIKDNDTEVQGIYDNLTRQLEEYKTDKSNFFSLLFDFIFTRQPFYAPFLSDLIDALDELQPKIRTLLLADFENDSIFCRILIDNVWMAEADLENPDWARCLQVFDRVIERAIAWGYPHIAAASAKGTAIIHDEYLHAPDTARKILQDIVSKVGVLPAIEEEQAAIYLHQKHYKEALDIYERILPKRNPSSEKLDVGLAEECRRAAVCAAHLDDWEKAATFFENGAAIAQKVDGTEEYIGLYADAGFAQFKAGNMLDSIKLLNLALQKFEMLPQDNTDLRYFILKERLESVIRWIAWYDRENYISEFEEPPVGFCSTLEINEEILTHPNSPIGYLWLFLAQIEYKFGHGTTVLEHALQVPDREAYPILNFFLLVLEVQYDFRNKTVEALPQRIHQIANLCSLIQSKKETEENQVYSISIADLPNLASVENITVMLVAALLVQLPTSVDMPEILATWRVNSSELPIKDNMVIVLNLIESILFGSRNNALAAMRAKEVKAEKQLVAALKICHSIETNPENLFEAHEFITTALITQTWLDPVVTVLAEFLSTQWLEQIESGTLSQMNKATVQQIEQACNSSETGKKKIGQILLAAYPVVSLMVPAEVLQQFRSWSE